MLGEIEGKKWGEQKMRRLHSFTDLVDMHLSRVQEIVGNRGAWCVAARGVAETDTTEGLNRSRDYFTCFRLEFAVCMP